MHNYTFLVWQPLPPGPLPHIKKYRISPCKYLSFLLSSVQRSSCMHGQYFSSRLSCAMLLSICRAITSYYGLRHLVLQLLQAQISCLGSVILSRLTHRSYSISPYGKICDACSIFVFSSVNRFYGSVSPIAWAFGFGFSGSPGPPKMHLINY